MPTHPLSRCVLGLLAALAALAVPVQPACALKKVMVRDPQRYKFTIDPATKPIDLLPARPVKALAAAPNLNEDLARVTELAVGEPVQPTKEDDSEKLMAHVIAKIKHLNRKDPDGFLKLLVANRPDLRGLPLLMGDACNSEYKHATLFGEIVEQLHRSEFNMRSGRFVLPEEYWTELAELERTDNGKHRVEANREEIERAKVAALMQVLGPAPAPYRVGLARHLATMRHVDATHALARLALFAPEESVQQAAVAGLKGRAVKDYAPVLLEGFRYPFPAVAKRAADAIIELQCKEVLADLVRVLEAPDPRAPFRQELDGQEVSAVRELVRINHHRNCVLCHAPADADRPARDILLAAVPLPDQTLGRTGYRFGSSPDIFVRTDVTYLRQDFSLMLRVEKADPWPQLQRFDFLVRTRVLNEQEAMEYVRQLAKAGASPAHGAAQRALQELTGHSPAPASPQEWRRVLKLQ